MSNGLSANRKANRTTRRTILGAIPALLLGRYATAAHIDLRGIRQRLAQVESETDGSVGVYALDTETGTRIGFNDGKRFAMASTFKWTLAAAVLARVESGALHLDQRVSFGKQDMLSNAPVSEAHLAAGSMTVGEMAAAVVEVSDNTAANLLLALIGGPPGLTRFLRSIGDPTTRLDRTELALNSNIPGDPRDTTTPRAMAHTLERVMLGKVLMPASRNLLTQWLVDARTGTKRLRASLPPDWRVGDKTGWGSNGAINDVAIAWPPGRKPLVIACYMSGSSLPTADLEGAHARIAEIISTGLKA